MIKKNWKNKILKFLGMERDEKEEYIEKQPKEYSGVLYGLRNHRRWATKDEFIKLGCVLDKPPIMELRYTATEIAKEEIKKQREKSQTEKKKKQQIKELLDADVCPFCLTANNIVVEPTYFVCHSCAERGRRV